MKLEPDVKQTILEFAREFPIPSGEVACQNWTHRLCQQLKYSHPANNWGHKSAGMGRPHSKDTIAIQYPFTGWDILIGAGAINPILDVNADSIDLTGQVFEFVEANNYLGDIVSPPIPPIPPIPEPPISVEEKLDQIIEMIRTFHDEEMEAIIKDRITRMA
jgi:hypothetical protein